MISRISLKGPLEWPLCPHFEFEETDSICYGEQLIVSCFFPDAADKPYFCLRPEATVLSKYV